MDSLTELLEAEGITAEILNVHTIKPLDTKTILESAKKTEFIITIEDHQKKGGLGSAISEFLSEEYPIPMKIIGVDDAFGESGKLDELYKKHKLNAENIADEIRKLLQKF